MDDIVRRNCSAVPRGTSGFDICASWILVFSSAVGCNWSNFYKNGKKLINTTNLPSCCCVMQHMHALKPSALHHANVTIRGLRLQAVFIFIYKFTRHLQNRKRYWERMLVSHMKGKCKITFEWVWLKLIKLQV